MTNIEWCDETINPIVGCSRVPKSPGCKNCYAAIAAASPRLQKFPQYQKVKNWDGTVEFVESALLKPLSWKKPKRIFVCSMSDLFHENIPDEWRDRIFAVMAMTPQHTYQVLTKRPENALKYFSPLRGSAVVHGGNPQDHTASQDSLKFKWRMQAGGGSIHDALPSYFKTGYFKFNSYWDELSLPLSNVWVGTTSENQAMADKRIPLLLKIPAKVRFLSCEPLLEDINLAPMLVNVSYQTHADPKDLINYGSCHPSAKKLLNWVIIGGESGKGARECRVDWVRSLVRQCQSANVPIFVKQLGSNCVDIGTSSYIDGVAKNSKGGNLDEFPNDLKIREFPDA